MNIKYTKKALKELQKLQPKIQIAIIAAINNIPNGDIKELKGFSDRRKRLRVGKFRVIYNINNQNDLEILLVIDIGSRGDIYK